MGQRARQDNEYIMNLEPLAVTYASVHTYTPKIAVRDNRGNTVREVDWYCLKPQADKWPEPRITRHTFNARNQLESSIDPRLFIRAKADAGVVENMRYKYSLSGRELRSESVDAGVRMALNNDLGQRLYTGDGRGTRTRCVYDEWARLIAVHEQLSGENEVCVERYTWGEKLSKNNARGQLIRHDDPAGIVLTPFYTIMGKASQETRYFLNAESEPDWPEAIADRDLLVEPEAYQTRWHYAPGGEIIQQEDAVGNVQQHRYTLLGLPFACDVIIPAQGAEPEEMIPVLYSTDYDVFDLPWKEIAGNHVTTWRETCPALQRLTRILVRSPGKAGRENGKALQDLHYTYDPGGNVITQQDAAQEVTFFNNQRVDGLCTYRYDSLSQLVRATGQESIKAGIQGPNLPECEPLSGPDAAQRINYTRQYFYDEGNNLICMKHSSNNGKKQYSLNMVVSPYSNHAVKQKPDNSITPEQVDEFFDENGNLLLLENSQPMSWDARNQLKSVMLPGHTENNI